MKISLITQMKVAVLFLFVSMTSAHGKVCPGFCNKNLTQCTANNGKIDGYCTDGFSYCCNTAYGVTGTCGAKLRLNIVSYFKSPQFPANSAGDLICQFNLKLRHNSVGVRLDFLHFESDERSFGPHQHTCDSDLFFIRGFQRWMPQARCGKFTGYSTVIPRPGIQDDELKTLVLLAVMSSPAYSWNIKITQMFEAGVQNDQQSLRSDDDEGILTGNTTGNATEQPRSRSNHLKRVRNMLARNESRSVKSTAEFTPEFDTGRNHRLSAIINGVKTDIKSVPWQASLRMFYTADQVPLHAIQEVIGENCSVSEGIHFCGGSVIDNQNILTAAHCFFGSSKTATVIDLSIAKVVLGDTNKCQDGNSSTYNSVAYDIERVTFHYAFDTASFANDVAIVHLKQKIQFNENIKAIRLAGTNFDLVPGMKTQASGWGTTEFGVAGRPSDLLLSNDHFTVQNETVCHGIVEDVFGATPLVVQEHGKYEHYFEGVFCTGSKLKTLKTREGSSGKGDSGGSLVFYRNNTRNQRFLQVGIVSFEVPQKSNSTSSSIRNDEEHSDAKSSATDPKRNCNVNEKVDFFMSIPFHRRWIDLVLY